MLPIVGIGAGLVSALLFTVVITGSPLALLLSYVAPLPVFIAALGWNHRAGLVAVAAGTLAVAVVLKLALGLAFAIGAALPAWWIAYLALLARDDGQGGSEWYPLGRLLVWIAAVATLVTVGGGLAISTDFETYRAVMTRGLQFVLTSREGVGPMVHLPAGVDAGELAARLAALVPVAAGASFVPMIVANLWLAGKAVQVSGRLPRPWPFIPATRLPAKAVAGLLGGVLLSFAGGFVGLAGAALSGALIAAFGLAGLAAVHDLSRGKPWRPPTLFAVYLALVIMLITVFPFLALLGIADALIDLRRPRPPASPAA
ncbi:DUF2232 domain-containing protein [Bosea sp. CS1GBMeth4]|uniref:DUF2232 domain-containing protein n=1 Tax=Bosea sp. CS1GBMeth4 TaxID=1892849 RepID=UPI0016460EE6|nr:DUF2232 domain-containing protein [Bosea sp. CS1GBMeth4]